MIKKILALFAVFFMLFSCGGTASSTSGKVLTINNIEEGKTIDPSLATESPSTVLHTFLSEGLSRYDVESKKFVPGLAEKWEVSEDGLVWTFTLRDGIKWSNGDPITAQDFKYSWLRTLNPETAAEYAYMLYPIKNAEEYNSGKASADDVAVKVIDDKTLEVTLKAVTPYFDSLVGFVTYLPQNEKFANEKGSQYFLEADSTISSGPFVLKEWTHNSEMKLVKNENYYDKNNIDLDEVVVKYIADSSAALNAFKNDEIDFTELTTEQYQEYKDDPRVVMSNVATTWYLLYNTEHKVLSNIKIRTAILEAINKPELTETVFNGLKDPAYILTPKGVNMPGGKTNDFGTEVGDLGVKYNPEEAKKLLAEGLSELGLSELPKISIILNDSGSNKKIGEAIQANLKQNLGIDVDIELMAFKERVARMHAKTFDIVLAGWGADYQDAMTFLDLLLTGGGNNHGNYSNPEYDRVVRAAQVETDKMKRFEYLKQAEEIIAKENPIGVLFQNKTIYLVNPKLSNYSFNAVGAKMNFERTKIK